MVVGSSGSRFKQFKLQHVGRDTRDGLAMLVPPIDLVDLPIELKLRVLSYLEQQDLCRLACVSRHFRELAHDPCLWRKITIECDLDEDVTASLVERTTMLKELSLRHCFQLMPWTDRCYDELVSLDLSFSCGVDAELVARFVERCPSLSHVSLEGCWDVDDMAVEELCRLPRLTSLNLSQCRQVTSHGLVTLARKARRLCSLNVTGIDNVSDWALCNVVWGLSDRLVSLALDGEHVSALGLAHLQQCGKIRSFSLVCAHNLTDAGMDAIKSLSSLRRLTLRRGHWLSADTLAGLFRGEGLRDLVALELGTMPLEDAGIQHLVDGCPHLEVLSLPYCSDVTEDGLATIVARCKNLTDLDITGMYTVTGVSLRDLPATLPRLRKLVLEMCYQVPSGLPSFLAGRVPGLKVYDLDGKQALPCPEMEDPFLAHGDMSPADDQEEGLAALDGQDSSLEEEQSHYYNDLLRAEPCTSLY